MSETFRMTLGVFAGLGLSVGAVFFLSPLGWVAGFLCGCAVVPFLIFGLKPQPEQLQQRWTVLPSQRSAGWIVGKNPKLLRGDNE